MGAMSPMHLAIVAIVALLVFGPKKLPELAKGLGEAVKEFKKTMSGEQEPETTPAAMAAVATPPQGTVPAVATGTAEHPGPTENAPPSSTGAGSGATPQS